MVFSATVFGATVFDAGEPPANADAEIVVAEGEMTISTLGATKSPGAPVTATEAIKNAATFVNNRAFLFVFVRKQGSCENRICAKTGFVRVFEKARFGVLALAAVV